LLPLVPNSELNIISGNYQFNFSEPAMRSRFNLYTRVPQTNCEEALRQKAEPNFHLSSIELIDAAENGWSREPQLRVPDRVIEALWLFSLAQ
jgi:hypothetical protein